MLTQLHIENIAVIENLNINFSEGFIALTGETGAGKSILIDSINILLGERTSKDIIRSGCAKAVVSACFENLSDETKGLLDSSGITSEDDVLILQRDITSDGRSVARVNGRQISVTMLREIGKSLINIHGQHENNTLLNPESHLKYLDMYSNNTNELYDCQCAYKHVQTLKRKIDKLTIDDTEKADKIEFLEYQIKEISEAGLSYPQNGEDEEDILTTKRNILANREKIMTNINDCWELLMSSERNAHDLISEADLCIIQASRYDESLIGFSEKLNSIYADLDSLLTDIRDYKSNSDFEYEDLNIIEERLDLIYKLKRKYGKNITEILDYKKKCLEELESIEFSEEKLIKLKDELKTALKKQEESAKKLTKSRVVSSKMLEEKIISELSFLDMPKVRFVVSIEDCEPGLNGADNVEFLMSTNIGETLRPMSKIASGGELSRIMLSIKNVLTKADQIETLIFDEIDTGVSGKAAQKIAIKLKQMSRDKQVIVVTHLAQIAAYATEHFLIQKKTTNERTYTTVSLLDYQARKKELANIMGGLNVTEATLATAEEMLKNANNENI